MTDVTRILNAIEKGDLRATDELLPLVYEELRLLAAQKLSQESPGQTLQATALVHEAYIRLVDGGCDDWSSRGHFFKAAAEAMRRILVENARRKKSIKGGGAYSKINLDFVNASNPGRPEELISLDAALSKLSLEDPPVVELVKLRYFAGLTLDQAAKVMGVSRRTVARYWDYGRVRLLHEMMKSDR
jgi:RNA polymerase sigma factor (TIGR02999 family)